jgi:hypothetical protein
MSKSLLPSAANSSIGEKADTMDTSFRNSSASSDIGGFAPLDSNFYIDNNLLDWLTSPEFSMQPELIGQDLYHVNSEEFYSQGQDPMTQNAHSEITMSQSEIFRSLEEKVESAHLNAHSTGFHGICTPRSILKSNSG